MYSLMNETPEPLARYKADVPIELQRMIDKSLAKEKENRYQHIDEMLVDLRKAQQESHSGAKSKKKAGKLPLLIGAGLPLLRSRSWLTSSCSRSQFQQVTNRSQCCRSRT